ncbi:membrane integrity-associated transporter subunit PqiC [Legionella worsleiensis]|uniref:ABC-type transport auxiliary lipoprotein component domain-containing protein n=1 Tax=Legionella worsleiensis TaxID=45076 RepID=A0A0W1AJM6_9GAMM|nr:PqiC family protein [Legionella worsleiensis]KTD81494.1 hypothetical protein Lwor_0532 [Legionella worsleiensis]STY32053.1 Protein of uncharacterised function (DUF330) [Legionella worsleiensis]
MSMSRLVVITVLGFMLCACGRSKQPEFYLLHPLPFKSVPVAGHTFLTIGLEPIHTPAFTEKPQLVIHDGLNRVTLDEFHQWAESLDKNIKGVIKTNLNTLIPGIVIEDAPWDIDFKPDYTLQIDIAEFKIDKHGDSSLRASYSISRQDNVLKKYDRYYHLHTAILTVDALVESMNSNLNSFTQDMAKSLIALKSDKIAR